MPYIYGMRKPGDVYIVGYYELGDEPEKNKLLAKLKRLDAERNAALEEGKTNNGR